MVLGPGNVIVRVIPLPLSIMGVRRGGELDFFFVAAGLAIVLVTIVGLALSVCRMERQTCDTVTFILRQKCGF